MPISWAELNKISGATAPITQRITPVVDATPKQATKTDKQSWWERWNILPAIGGTAGVITGAIAGPPGVIAGGAGGSFLGEGLEQLLTGKRNIKGLATETALGGAGGVIGKLLGAGRPAAQAAGRAITKEAPLGIKLGAKIMSQEMSFPTAKLAAKFSNENAFKEILQHNPPVVGLKGFISKVVGRGSVLEKTLQHATGSIKKPIDFSPALTAAREALASPENAVFITSPKAANNTLRIITNILDNYTSKEIGKINPQDGLDAVRALDKTASSLLEKGGGGSFLERILTSISPQKLEAQHLASAYSEAADTLLQQINKMAVEEGVLAKGIPAKLLSEAAKISPRLMEQISTAPDIHALRALQSNWVRASQAIAASGAAAKGTSGAAMSALMRRLVYGGGGFVAGGPVGAIGGVLGAPFLEQAVEGARVPIATAAAKVTSGLGGAAGGVTKLPPILATLLGQGAVRGPQALQTMAPTAPPQEETALPPELANLLQAPTEGAPQEQNPYPLENFIADVQRDPKNEDTYRYIYEQYQQQYAAPKVPVALQTQMASANSSLNVLN